VPVSFWTPVTYQSSTPSFGKKLLEYADAYFCWEGKKVCVIPGFEKGRSEGVVPLEEQASRTLLKVFSCGTLIIPAPIFCLKLVLRSIYSFHVIQIWPDPATELPREVVLEVFSFLNRKELFKAMQTCKTWQSLTQDSLLWQKEFALFGLTKDPAFSLLSSSMSSFKVLAERPRLRLTKLIGSGVQKVDLHEDFKKGFFAELELYKLGLHPVIYPQIYADVLFENYQDKEGWFWVANTLINQNQWTSATDIISRYFRKSVEQNRLIKKIVTQYSSAKKFQAAIDLLKWFSEDEAWLRESALTLLTFAVETQDLELTEMVIDQVDCEGKLFAILSLIHHYLDVNRFEKAEALVRKYQTFIDGAKDFEVDRIIEMYVRFNEFKKAWDLAMKNKKNKRVFLVLRNAFNVCSLNDQAEKVNQFLENQISSFSK